jgi:hypothetical protein
MGRGTVGEKGQTGRPPWKQGSQVAERETLRFASFLSKERKEERTRGDGGRQELPSGFRGEKPERPEAQESTCLDLGS